MLLHSSLASISGFNIFDRFNSGINEIIETSKTPQQSTHPNDQIIRYFYAMIGGMSKGEMVDVLDANGEVIGTMPRKQAEQHNHMTANVILFVFNAAKEVWLQKRPMSKDHYPGLWDASACGSIKSGETPLEAMQREQSEEMGFVSNFVLVDEFVNTFPDETGTYMRTRLSYLFVGESEEIPQTGPEVDEFVARDYMEQCRLIADNPEQYVPSLLLELQKASEAYFS